MYIPKYYREEDRQKTLAFLKQNNFPAIVSFDGERPIATHTPVEVVENENGKVTIYAHISRANPQWKTFDNQEILLIFQGAHTYISPRWYNHGGWLDLLGQIPSFGVVFKYSVLFRLARLRRLVRILHTLDGESKEALVKDVIENRESYTGFFTVLMALLVLTVASVLVLQFESGSPYGNIKTSADALWYSIVTLTTVAYGDRFPVTLGGRITAFFIMLMGVGIIAALASILSSLLVGPSASGAAEGQPGKTPGIKQELADIRSELAALRRLLEKTSAESD